MVNVLCRLGIITRQLTSHNLPTGRVNPFFCGGRGIIAG
ncbi:hypothetical protein DAQ1742_03887 [Dickeya aquatica]|uniref:Uncharacterized protein n=1 Tax=Dickeya aquatica TaxID=1401087 RepID=A0A375AEZ5_9GAMM|nr:hypothetical protein DAQ1742_03887 [Dickeya aquatica]